MNLAAVMYVLGCNVPCVHVCLAVNSSNDVQYDPADTKYRTIGLGPISVAWATDSLVWLVSITLLLAILSATLCLCRMQFANDTLLFAHAKAD